MPRRLPVRSLRGPDVGCESAGKPAATLPSLTRASAEASPASRPAPMPGAARDTWCIRRHGRPQSRRWPVSGRAGSAIPVPPRSAKGADGSIRVMDTDDSMAELYADADRLKGLTLRDLGFVPHPDSLSSHERAELDAETLERMAGISAEDRRLGLDRARLLAGALWQASVFLVDELFEDIIALYGKGQITREDIDETSVLWSLPPQYATRYTGRFARRFLLVAADLTTKLAGTWTMPSCVAQELAVRCLLDKVDLIAATYDLDLEPDWRGTLTDRMLEDTDSEMLYDPSLDGFQHNEQLTESLRLAPMTFEHWFEPFGEDRSVAPYARTG